MVSAVGSTPYSYYNVLNPPVKPVTPVTNNTSTDSAVKSNPVEDAVKLSAPAIALMNQLLNPSTNTDKNLGLNGIFRQSQNTSTTDAYISILSAAYSPTTQKTSEQVASAKITGSRYDVYQAVSNLISK